MKRAFIIVLSLALLAGAGFAEETKPTLSVGGNLTWGFVANPGESQYDDVLDWADIYFTGETDEYNSYKVLLEYYGGTNELQEPDDIYVDEAYVTSNLARYFGLDAFGVNLDWRNGFDDTNAAINSAGTRYGFDEITDTNDLSTDDTWMSELTIGYMDLLKLKSSWAWDTDQGNDDIPDMLFEASTGVSGVNVAATYTTNRTAGGALSLTTSTSVARFVPTLEQSGVALDLGASYAMNLSESADYVDAGVTPDSIAPEQSLWGASMKVGFLGADLGVSYKGGAEDEDNMAYGYTIVGVDAGYQITTDLGVYGGMAFDLTDYEAVDPTIENIEGLSGGEIGATLDIGKTNFQSGYWFTDGYGAGAINALGANQDGGIFFRFTHSWGGA